MITKNPLALSIAVACAFFTTVSADAATITWGLPTQIAADTDVSTNGTLVGAFNIGDTGVTASGPINGVDFTPFALPSLAANNTVGNFTVTTNSVTGFFSDNANFGSGATPFSNLSPNYQNLLEAGTTIFEGDTLTLSINGLTAGQQYEFQFFANFSGFGQGQTTATAGNAVSVLDNTIGLAGGLGEYAVGTFTADATTMQTIVFTALGISDFTSSLNGFQLRQLTPGGGGGGVIPEPTTALFGLALAGVCLGRRRRQRAQTLQ